MAGYSVVVHTKRGEQLTNSYINSTEALWYAKKLCPIAHMVFYEVYMKQPNGSIVTLFNSRKEERMNDPFETFREENPEKFTPYLDGKNTDDKGNDHPGPGKETLWKAKLPFRILRHWGSTGQFGATLNYHIQFDAAHPLYKAAFNLYDIETEYIMSMSASDSRSKQATDLLTDKNGYLGPKGKFLVLVKVGVSGRRFDFSDAQSRGLYDAHYKPVDSANTKTKELFENGEA